MNQIIKIAWDLNDNCENRYGLVYEIAELAKKLVDENQSKKKTPLNTQLWLKLQKSTIQVWLVNRYFKNFKKPRFYARLFCI